MLIKFFVSLIISAFFFTLNSFAADTPSRLVASPNSLVALQSSFIAPDLSALSAEDLAGLLQFVTDAEELARGTRTEKHIAALHSDKQRTVKQVRELVRKAQKPGSVFRASAEEVIVLTSEGPLAEGRQALARCEDPLSACAGGSLKKMVQDLQWVSVGDRKGLVISILPHLGFNKLPSDTRAALEKEKEFFGPLSGKLEKTLFAKDVSNYISLLLKYRDYNYWLEKAALPITFYEKGKRVLEELEHDHAEDIARLNALEQAVLPIAKQLSECATHDQVKSLDLSAQALGLTQVVEFSVLGLDSRFLASQVARYQALLIIREKILRELPFMERLLQAYLPRALKAVVGEGVEVLPSKENFAYWLSLLKNSIEYEQFARSESARKELLEISEAELSTLYDEHSMSGSTFEGAVAGGGWGEDEEEVVEIGDGEEELTGAFAAGGGGGGMAAGAPAQTKTSPRRPGEGPSQVVIKKRGRVGEFECAILARDIGTFAPSFEFIRSYEGEEWKKTDPLHQFPKSVDNFLSRASKERRRRENGSVYSFYSLWGTLKFRKEGRNYFFKGHYEYAIDSNNKCFHRFFRPI